MRRDFETWPVIDFYSVIYRQQSHTRKSRKSGVVRDTRRVNSRGNPNTEKEGTPYPMTALLPSGISLAPSRNVGDCMRKHPADPNPLLCSEECTYARSVAVGSAGVCLEHSDGDAGRSCLARRCVSSL